MTLNAFEHQQFLLRRPPTPEHPLGERVRRSYRQIMTGPDEPLSFDYPREDLNVAAIGLCAALTQTLFEPKNRQELERRLRETITEEEFEQAVAGLRDVFSIDGEIRFMQGRKPELDAKGRIKNLALLHEKLNVTTSSFMNRPDTEWAVALDQIPLLVFTRSTFYEKSAGRGYLTGTSGDLEIRTYLFDPASLRRSVWLNVLTRQAQQEEDFIAGDSSDTSEGYNAWMWHTPPTADVPQGRISLRSGLFWMVANNYIVLEKIETPRTCIVTGDDVTGNAGTGVVTASTGIGYGVTVERDKGPAVRMSFFRHPNAPFQEKLTKEQSLYIQHLRVDEVSGLLGQMGALFFSGASSREGYHIAPILRQYIGLHPGIKPSIDLLCFGFHMLSSKKNVHGGYEFERFHYPVLNADDPGIFERAQGILVGAASVGEDVRKLLVHAVQLCTKVQVDEKEDDGRSRFVMKSKLENGNDYKSFVRDLGREFWSLLSPDVGELLQRIEANGSSSELLGDAADDIMNWWRKRAGEHARTIFLRVFDNYSNSPLHLAAAYTAKNVFYGSLWKKGIRFADTTPENTPQSTTGDQA